MRPLKSVCVCSKLRGTRHLLCQNCRALVQQAEQLEVRSGSGMHDAIALVASYSGTGGGTGEALVQQDLGTDLAHLEQEISDSRDNN